MYPSPFQRKHRDLGIPLICLLWSRWELCNVERVNCQTQDISFLTVIWQPQYVSLYSIPGCGQTTNLNFSAVSNHESLCILPGMHLARRVPWIAEEQLSGHWILDIRQSTLDIGHWTLDNQNWTLDIGHLHVQLSGLRWSCPIVYVLVSGPGRRLCRGLAV